MAPFLALTQSVRVIETGVSLLLTPTPTATVGQLHKRLDLGKAAGGVAGTAVGAVTSVAADAPGKIQDVAEKAPETLEKVGEAGSKVAGKVAEKAVDLAQQVAALAVRNASIERLDQQVLEKIPGGLFP